MLIYFKGMKREALLDPSPGRPWRTGLWRIKQTNYQDDEEENNNVNQKNLEWTLRFTKQVNFQQHLYIQNHFLEMEIDRQTRHN